MSVAQINSSLQAALAAIGYPTNTTTAQAKQDFTAISNNLAIVPQGITLAVSVARTTSTVKNLSSPVTPEEGNYFLTVIQNLRTAVLGALNALNIRIPAIEAAIPGLSKFCLTTLKSLVDPLAQALTAAAPPNIPKGTIQEIHSSINVAIQSSLARVAA
ncbi:hypothetical protein Clacol_005942 [Clathrus columnatus]|uniref:Uncharacterized protein n=1 Tax=Clathrus columnatus TaxID=1419009 RepID=A0AAV5AGU1_9AGAM|nr:hypothetical protein Clacol_005942 [Clathrus columnatus]